MWFCTTLGTSGFLRAEFVAVSKFLAFVAPQGVWNVSADVVSDISGEQSRRQGGGLEGDDEKVCVASLSVAEGGQTAHV